MSKPFTPSNLIAAAAPFLLLLMLLWSSTGIPAVEGSYSEALEKSLLFFEAQRSGKLPVDQRVLWRGDSGLKDGFDAYADLVGGYYDSGDHVKFGFPMAFGVTMLSWSLIKFDREIIATNQLEYTLDAIRWGTDYFIKAHKQPNVLWVQVGDGDTDHVCWERAEDMTTPRTAYKIDCENPGSDVAAETAAALAAAAIAFRPYNSSYSKLLLVHSQQLFRFADTFRGRYDKSVHSVIKFYPSSTGYDDELLWAAAWLFEATDDKYYINYVAENAVMLGGTGWAVSEFSWDNKYAGVQVLLAKVLFEGGAENYSPTLTQYKAKAEFFLCSCLQKNNGNNVAITQGGLLYFNELGNLAYVAAASFLLAAYSDYLTMAKASLNCPEGQITAEEVLAFAQTQVDYILGKNPKGMSYLVGYGSYYPTHVHHRGSSIPSIFVHPAAVRCLDGFDYFKATTANPNVVEGALVAGPGRDDLYADDRSNYGQSEPALVGNAALVGLLARMTALDESSNHDDPATPSTPATSFSTAVEFIHTITNTWTYQGEEFYRHKVTVKNISGKAMTFLKVWIDNLNGPLWGLTPTDDYKNSYVLPSSVPVFGAGAVVEVVYIQGGAQAKFTVIYAQW